MDAIGAGQFDQRIKFGYAMFHRLEGTNDLSKGTTGYGIVARGFHEGLGPPGLFVRGDHRLQRQNVQGGIARSLSVDQNLGRGGFEMEIGYATAIVETCDRLPFDSSKFGDDQRWSTRPLRQYNGDISGETARNAGCNAVDLVIGEACSRPLGKGIRTRCYRNGTDGFTTGKSRQPF